MGCLRVLGWVSSASVDAVLGPLEAMTPFHNCTIAEGFNSKMALDRSRNLAILIPSNF